MNAQNTQNATVITKETKRRIRVDFERTPLADRLKSKFISMYFLGNVVWYIFRLLLLVGVSFVILYPFIAKIAGSFMAAEDFVDVTVRLIPKHFTAEQYKYIFLELGYTKALLTTAVLSLVMALLQTFVCTLIGYGLAKFKFKGNKLVMILVVITMVIPHQTLRVPLFMQFRYFDVYGIWQLITGKPMFNLINTYAPLTLLSVCGLAFKNGLYIFMMRQFFRGVPDELEESAYVDGSGTFRTFVQIIIPLSVPMLITIFLFAFSWQWTDEFYTGLLMPGAKFTLMRDIVAIPSSLKTSFAGQDLYYSAIYNTCGIMIILPLLVVYLFCQRYLIQGIERSGIVG